MDSTLPTSTLPISQLLDPSPAPEQSTHGLDILTDAIQGASAAASSSSPALPPPPPPQAEQQPILPFSLPLINPLQTNAPPPSSTYAEPSRSPPPPPNFAPTVPSTPAALPSTPVAAAAEEPAYPMIVDPPVFAIIDPPSFPIAQAPPAPVPAPTFAVETNGNGMDVDPQPPIIATHQAIPDILQPIGGAFPTPVAQVFDPIAAAEPQPQVAVEQPVALATSPSGGVKRSAPDDEEGEGREMKRVKEETGGVPSSSGGDMVVDHSAAYPPINATSSYLAPQLPAPAAFIPAPAQLPPAFPPAPHDPSLPLPYIPGTYRPPQLELPGLSSPLTLNQQRQFLVLLRNLKKQAAAFPFLNPVDPILLGIPHYPQYIQFPMDLSTVETKLIVSNPGGKGKSGGAKWDESKGRYANGDEVVVDVRRIWENTRIFNGPEHPVSKSANMLEEFWDKGMVKIPRGEISSKPSPAGSPMRRASTPSDRPKREIHPPAPKDLAWDPASEQGKKAGGSKRRMDAQLKWAAAQIDSLASSRYADNNWVFTQPVDAEKSGAPDYYQVIKRPMDLATIRSKINDGRYSDVSEVNEDVKLMFRNCYQYNPPLTNVYIMGQKLEEAWKAKWRSLPSKEAQVMGGSEDGEGEEYDDYGGEVGGEVDEQLRQAEAQLAELQRKVDSLRRQKARKDSRKQKASASALVGASKPSKAMGPSHHGQKSGKHGANGKKKSGKVNGVNGNGHGGHKKAKPEYDDEEEEEEEEKEETVTLEQKQELADKIQLAGNEVLGKAIQIIQETSSLGDNGEEIELDIDALEPATILKLYNLVVLGITEPERKKKKSGVMLKNGGKKQGNTRKKVDDEAEQRRIDDMQKQLAMFEKDEDSDGSEDYDDDE